MGSPLRFALNDPNGEQIRDLTVTAYDEELPCRIDPDLFFLTGRTHSRQAAEMCAICPILQECRDYAIQAREPFGVWGALTAGERRKLWKKRDTRGVVRRAS